MVNTIKQMENTSADQAKRSYFQNIAGSHQPGFSSGLDDFYKSTENIFDDLSAENIEKMAANMESKQITQSKETAVDPQIQKLYEEQVASAQERQQKVPIPAPIPYPCKAPYMSNAWLEQQEGGKYFEKKYDTVDYQDYMKTKVQKVLDGAALEREKDKNRKYVDPVQEIDDILFGNKKKSLPNNEINDIIYSRDDQGRLRSYTNQQKDKEHQAKGQKDVKAQDKNSVNPFENKAKVDFDQIRQDYEAFKSKQLGNEGRKGQVDFQEAVDQISELKAKNMQQNEILEPESFKIETPKFDASAYPSHKHKFKSIAKPLKTEEKEIKPSKSDPSSWPRPKQSHLCDEFSVEEILQCKKLAAVAKEDYLLASEIKHKIKNIKQWREELVSFEAAKKEAVQVEDYQKAHSMKVKSEEVRNKIQTIEQEVNGKQNNDNQYQKQSHTKLKEDSQELLTAELEKEKMLEDQESLNQLQKLKQIEPKYVGVSADQEEHQTKIKNLNIIPPVDEELIAQFADDTANDVQKFLLQVHKEPTPIIELKALAKSLNLASISIKDESQRPAKTYKTSGVLYTMARMMAEMVHKDLSKTTVTELRADFCLNKGHQIWVCATDYEGAMGRALALAARFLGQKCHIYCPKGMAQERINEIELQGARIFNTCENFDQSIRIAQDYTLDNGYYFLQDMDLNAFTDSVPTWIMQGYTLLAKEACEQLSQKPSHIFLQAGTGSMAASVAAYITNLYSDSDWIPKIIVVEPINTACIYKSGQAGQMSKIESNFPTMCAGLACTRPNRLAWNILRDTTFAFMKFDDQIAGNGMRLANAFKLKSGECGSVGLGILHQILTHNDAHAKAITKLLELDQNSNVLFINTDGISDKKSHMHQMVLPMNPGKIQLLLNELKADFTNPSSYSWRMAVRGQGFDPNNFTELGQLNQNHQEERQVPVVSKEESHVAGRKKIQDMIKDIYLNDYGKNIDLIPQDQGEQEEQKEQKENIEDNHIATMKDSMQKHKKSMSELNKDYFENVVNRKQSWDNKISHVDKKNLTDFQEEENSLEKEIPQNDEPECEFSITKEEKAQLRKMTIGEILAGIDQKREVLDNATKSYDKIQKQNPKDFQERKRIQIVRRGETIGITTPSEEAIKNLEKNKKSIPVDYDSTKTWAEYKSKSDDCIIDDKIEKLNDFNHVPTKPENHQDYFKTEGIPERHKNVIKHDGQLKYVQPMKSKKMPMQGGSRPTSLFKQLRKLKSDKVDTIPCSLKPYFWATKEMPNILDYNVIGFDADHCLVKYNVMELTKFILPVILDELHLKFGYPETIKNFNWGFVTTVFNHVVWDVEKGTFLKLNSNQKIIYAVRGFQKLGPEAIENLYGTERIFSQLQWRKSLKKLDQEKGAYFVCQTQFDIPKFLAAAQVIQMITIGEVQEKTYLQLAFDIQEIMVQQWKHFNEDEVLPIASFGRYFPEFLKNPQRFIQPQPELQETLQQLKSEGKHLYVCTNAHVEYMEIILETTLGKNWKQMFSLCIANAQKPLFMQAKSPFLLHDPKAKNLSGGRMHVMDLVGAATGACTNIVMQGNAYTLASAFQVLLQKQQLKFAFFGDHILTDVYATYELNQTLITEVPEKSRVTWDAFAIIEELFFEELTFCDGEDPQIVPHDKDLWGNSYFMANEQNYSSRDFFMSEVQKVARYAVPFLKNINLWMPQKVKEKPQDLQPQNGMLKISRELLSRNLLRNFSQSGQNNFQFLNQAQKLANSYIKDANRSPQNLEGSSFFDFFQVPRRFDINKKELKEIYKTYQKVMHPDLFTNGPELEEKANQLSAFCSVAFKTLVNSEDRANHLLKAHYGIDAFSEGQIQYGQIPDELFELRMSIDQTTDHSALATLQKSLLQQHVSQTSKLNELFENKDFKGVTRVLHKSKYLQSALTGIEKKIASLPLYVHNEVIEIQSKEQLDQLIKTVPGLIIDFFATWCGPCLNMATLFEEFANKNRNQKLAFCKVNIDKLKDVANNYKVERIPQFNFIKDGKDLSIMKGDDSRQFGANLNELEKFCGYS